MNPFKGTGFQSYKEEQKKRDQANEARRGSLWRYFLTDGETDAPLLFLTSEPVLFEEHTVRIQGKIRNFICTGSGCSLCAEGNKPSFKGAFLVLDRREFEAEERDKNGEKTGKKVTVTDKLKLLVRGSTDLAKLDNKNTKFGLGDKMWYITKLGTGKSTSYEFERGEAVKLSDREKATIFSQINEKYHTSKGIDFVKFIQDQLLLTLPSDIVTTDEDVEKEVKRLSRGTASRNSEPVKRKLGRR